MTDKDALLKESQRFLSEFLHGHDGVSDEDCEWCQLSARITAALAEGDGWMPIESAPKDGNKGILISGGNFFWDTDYSAGSAPLDFVDIGYWNERDNRFDDGGDRQFWFEPTHCRELPPPPKGE